MTLRFEVDLFNVCTSSLTRTDHASTCHYPSITTGNLLILIIIPCFNEADRLDTDAFIAHVRNYPDTNFLLVDDGSTDATPELLRNLASTAGGRISTMRLSTNQGKAEAVRQGMLNGLNQPVDYLGFWDADLATPLTTIELFSEKFTASPLVRMVSGARIQRIGASINRHWYRHFPGRLIAIWINLILNLPLHDTQCGAKLIERRLAAHIFSEPFVSSWLFDVELFARVIGLVGREEAARILYEMPLPCWNDVGKSKISVAYLPRIPFELVKIRHYYRTSLNR